jgi:hypothetical protein
LWLSPSPGASLWGEADPVCVVARKRASAYEPLQQILDELRAGQGGRLPVALRFRRPAIIDMVKKINILVAWALVFIQFVAAIMAICRNVAEFVVRGCLKRPNYSAARPPIALCRTSARMELASHWSVPFAFLILSICHSTAHALSDFVE